MVKKSVSPEEFVRQWQSAESVAAVSDATGLSPQTCAQRACNYRKKGIALKNFMSRRGRHLDITALAKLAKSLAPKENRNG